MERDFFIFFPSIFFEYLHFDFSFFLNRNRKHSRQFFTSVFFRLYFPKCNFLKSIQLSIRLHTVCICIDNRIKLSWDNKRKWDNWQLSGHRSLDKFRMCIFQIVNALLAFKAIQSDHMWLSTNSTILIRLITSFDAKIHTTVYSFFFNFVNYLADSGKFQSYNLHRMNCNKVSTFNWRCKLLSAKCNTTKVDSLYPPRKLLTR